MPSATLKPFPDSSYQSRVGVDALNTVMTGFAYEYNFNAGTTFRLEDTPVGILTRGLVYGLSDYWIYYDKNTQQAIGWTMIMP